MSAIQNIVVADGKTTPVDHTLIPVTSGLNASWRENASGLPLIGQMTVATTLKLGSNGINRVRCVLDIPALETATAANSSGYTAAPRVAYSNRVAIEFILPSRGTDEQRRDLRVILSNLLAGDMASDLIDHLNAAY